MTDRHSLRPHVPSADCRCKALAQAVDRNRRGAGRLDSVRERGNTGRERLDDAGDLPARARLIGQVARERAVDLDRSDHQLVPARERRVAGAEAVDRDTRTAAAQEVDPDLAAARVRPSPPARRPRSRSSYGWRRDRTSCRSSRTSRRADESQTPAEGWLPTAPNRGAVLVSVHTGFKSDRSRRPRTLFAHVLFGRC
jgi:hypothetical protein